MRNVEAVPITRMLKAARCRHCDFCRPRGAAFGVCLCAQHAGAVVVADMLACGDYRPLLRQPAREAA